MYVDIIFSEFCVINASTVEVELDAKPEEAPVAADFEVLANDEAVEVSKVEKKAADLKGKTYRLTVATLAGEQGALAINVVDAKVAEGQVYEFDFKAPEVTGITAKGPKSLEVKLSEEINVNSVAAANFEVSKGSASKVASTAILSADKKMLTLTFEDQTVVIPLTVADYVLTLSKATDESKSIEDIAGNKLYKGTEVTFRPTAGQLEDQSAPELTKSVYDAVLGELTLTFNKNITTADTTKIDIATSSSANITLAAADIEGDATEAKATWTFDLGKTNAAKANSLDGLSPAPNANNLKVIVKAGAVKNTEDVLNVAGQEDYAKG